jgi:hypothetical protein
MMTVGLFVFNIIIIIIIIIFVIVLQWLISRKDCT